MTTNEIAKRAERDYLETTIATVRNHRGTSNAWPQWANIFADEIEALWKENDALARTYLEQRDALDAYGSAYPCPGIEIEPGLTSGCNGGADCPTCRAFLAGQEGSA